MTHQWQTLCAFSRGSIVEREVFGAISVSHGSQELLKIGNPDLLFGRSLMKPFQMMPLTETLDTLLSDEQKAISLSSHSGTARHREIARSINGSDFDPYLQTPPALPLGGPLIQSPKDSWTHNCSGKHAAILRACRTKKWGLENYNQTSHPYYEAYRTTLEGILKKSLQTRPVEPDGCTLPTIGLSISELSELYSHLARTRDQNWIWRSYQGFPELIGGEGRLDTAIARHSPHLLAKEGADGLLGISAHHPRFPQGLGVVIKLAHGFYLDLLGLVAEPIIHALSGRPLSYGKQPKDQKVTLNPSLDRFQSLLS